MYANTFGYANPYLANQFGQYGQQIQPQGIKSEVVKVNGKNGADAYQLASNSSILLLDETAPVIWLKTTDGAGYATVTPYKIEPYTPEPVIDIKSLEERIAKLEGRINEQSNITSARRSTDATDIGADKKHDINGESKSESYSYAKQFSSTESGV